MTHPTPAPRGNLLWAAVDFDNTLAEAVWTPENPTAALGKPIERNVEKCRALSAAGYKICVHTSRPDADYEAIEMWLVHYDIPFKSIRTGKVLAAIYVDDRAVHADDDWLGRAKEISPIGEPQ